MAALEGLSIDFKALFFLEYLVLLNKIMVFSHGLKPDRSKHRHKTSYMVAIGILNYRQTFSKDHVKTEIY